MAQGQTIKGKTTSNQNVEVLVDEEGRVATTTRLYGYHADTDTWLPVLVDETGQLLGVGGGSSPSNLYGEGLYGTAEYA